MGFEPTTPGTTIQCSNQLSYIHHNKKDFIIVSLAIQFVDQLSYFVRRSFSEGGHPPYITITPCLRASSSIALAKEDKDKYLFQL